MPEPVDSGHRYVRGLDGLRAVAVVAVVAFHLGLSWAPGGLLGVGVFFTLSGYLITDLLLAKWDGDGRLHLGNFWARRARRLLPAVATLLIGVLIWVAVAEPSQLGDLAGNIGAAAGYFSNWWLIFHHISYFARFGPPSPLGHLWSLAIEEQFYLVWPWLLWLGLRYIRRRWMLASLAMVLSTLSALEMALLWHRGMDPTRIYDGTDTRAFGLLIGAALAFVWPSRPRRGAVTRINTRRVEPIGWIALAGILAMVFTVGEYSSFLYLGGFGLLSVATAIVVAVVVLPGSLLGRVLGMRPLKWLGVRSYGIYLWHYPIVVLTTPTLGPGSSTSREFLQVVATLAVAALSWRFIEDPIRSGSWRQWRLPTWKPNGFRVTPDSSPAIFAGALAAVAIVSLTVVSPASSVDKAARNVSTSSLAAEGGTSPPEGGTSPVAPTTTLSPKEKDAMRTLSRLENGAGQAAGSRTIGPPTPLAPLAPTPLATSCQAVVHIGDSTSESLISADYLPNPAQRLDAQYQRVGVKTVIDQISGARSIVETYDGQPNGYQVAQQLVASGYHGCWVIALGTNDTANIAVGSHFDENTRIARMMSVIGNQPVMWVNVVSLLSSGPYSAANMQKWDTTLDQACSQYPNLRVLDWAADANPAWFINDGIHYSSTGSAERAALIADGLAKAFPVSATSDCVVR